MRFNPTKVFYCVATNQNRKRENSVFRVRPEALTLMIISNAGPRTIIGEHPGRCNLLGCNVRDSSPYAVFGRRSPLPVADPGAGWGTARGFLCFTQHTGRCNLLGSYVEDSSPYTRSVADVLPFRLQTARGFLCFAHNTQAAAIFWGPTSRILRPARSLADVSPTFQLQLSGLLAKST